jgi:hypothetical protein
MSLQMQDWMTHNRSGFPKDLSPNDNISVMLRTGDIVDTAAKDVNWTIRFHPDDVLEYCVYDDNLDGELHYE